MSKRGNHRRLNQMNGDYLSQLKKPLRSEMNSHVIGTNKAVATLMNKRLDLYFKDKNIALEKIRRRQEAVYGTMLRVLKEKKILQRIAYKRRQEEGWHMFTKNTDSKTEADIIKIEDSTESKELSRQPDESSRTNFIKKEGKENQTVLESTKNDQLSESSSSQEIEVPIRTYERRAKVLEVTKRSPLAPITRERSDIGKDLIADGKDNRGSVGIGRELLPDIKPAKNHFPVQEERSTTDLIIESVSKAQNVNSVRSLENRTSDSPVKPHLPSPTRLGNNSSTMPPISERSRDRTSPVNSANRVDSDPANKHHAARAPESCEPSPATSNKNGTGSDENGSEGQKSCSKKTISLALHNRRRALAKLRRCHEELDKEPFTVYVKDKNGNYVPSNTEFKRKQFHPPSLKEKYFQKKMLRAQMEARIEQRRKLEAFFERMAEEERERQRIREAFKRQALEEAEEMRRKLQEESEKLGFSPSQLVALFSQGILPKGIDPSSFEAIRYCKYIRIYPLNYGEITSSETSDNEKVTSWTSTKLPL